MDTPTSYCLSLTHNEMVALIKYHAAQVRSIPKKVGKISMQLAAESPTLKMKELKDLHDDAAGLVAHHMKRAKGILSLLPPTKKD